MNRSATCYGQNAAVARAKKALRSADKGLGLMTAEGLLAGMKQRADAAQKRIKEAVPAPPQALLPTGPSG